MRPTRWSVPILMAVALVGPSLAPKPIGAQIRPPEVTNVRFEGNETFPDDSLARAIVTRETNCRSTFFFFLCPFGFDFALDRSELRERDLPRDRARLVLWYRQRGFRDVQVDPPRVVRVENRAEVVFPVVEGTPVIADTLAFVVAEEVEIEGLLDGLPIQAGERLSTITLDATRDSIIDRLANVGYAYAEVYRNALRPSDAPYRARVTFEIVPGPRSTYGDVSVEGIENLDVGTVLRTVQISTGSLYRKREIEEAATRLYGLPIVRSASVVPDTLSIERDSVIDVAITIREGDAYRVRAGGGLSTAECFNVEARWTSRNFVGGGRSLQLRGRLGNIGASNLRDPLCLQSGEEREFTKLTGVASVEFVQPWIFSTRNSLSASIFAERQSLPDIFVRLAYGAQLALSRTIAPQTILTGSLRPELTELRNADEALFCTGFLVCDPSDIRQVAGRNLLSPVGLSLTQDRADDLLNPRDGHRFFLDLEHAAGWMQSDFRYDRAVAEASKYVPVGGVVLAARIRGGWVGSGGFEGLGSTTPSVEIVPPQKRFYTGGANSVRGFAQSGLGPRVLVATPDVLLSFDDSGGRCRPEELAPEELAPEELAAGSCLPVGGTGFQPRPTGGTRVLEANAELRFPVGAVFEGVVFGDVGQAWGRTQSVNLGSLEVTPGIGVRFPSPVGPIRVDLAYRFRGAESLSVITQKIVPFDADIHDENDKIVIRTGLDRTMTIEWVTTGTLIPLDSPFLFGENDRGLQLHVSIGQAF